MTELVPNLIARNIHVVYRTRIDDRPSIRARLRGAKKQSRVTEVHAVKGVDITLLEGESIGIVGSNGSGKTTLVTALAGLLELSDGEILAAARPALLGVGAALNRRLSGRRNIMLGLLALGLSREEIDDRMGAIIEFCGLGDSIDRPMKTYSSGMRARLAFTIATEVTPEILIVDEALAVGDRGFRARAAERLEEIRATAGSIVVVSHNLNEIASTCTQVIWLENGEIFMQGPTEVVLPEYESANPTPATAKRELRRQARRAKRAQERAAGLRPKKRRKAKLEAGEGAQ